MKSQGGRSGIFVRFKRRLDSSYLWLYICKILEKSPASVAEIKRVLRSDYDLVVPTITLYSILYRMEREGLVKRRDEFPTRYELTSYGLLQYKKSLHLLEERLLMLKE